MTEIAIREAEAGDFERILALNDAEVRQTSAMDLQRLEALVRLSSLHRVAVVDGRVAAFLLAMREAAAYRNDNYAWFAARHARFVYVDRIVVGSGSAGLGIGSLLYADLFGYARAQGVGIVACEYNIEPPNPASQRFHGKFGFRQVGAQRVAGGTKLVSLQVAEA